MIAHSPPRAHYAPVKPYNIRVISTNVSPRRLAGMEKAIAKVANGRFRLAWHTPYVRFVHSGQGDAQLILTPGGNSDVCGTDAWGCHYTDPISLPIATARVSGDIYDGLVASHEVFEMLVDPQTTRYVKGFYAEVCDPVDGDGSMVDGIYVADYVLPAFYTRHAKKGPFDALHIVTAPLTPDSSVGGFMP